jgi:tRNA(Ile)-lysidine synthase
MPLHPLEHDIRRVLADTLTAHTAYRVLVGVSAGADSMTLLHILAALRHEYGLTLVAAYIDHGLRPEETPMEWACVQEAADRLGIKSLRASVDVHGLATARKLSLEHAAREARYQAFADLGQQENASLLVLGHTADDQVEELLIRLFRGGGGRALAGMRPRSGQILRPLLGIRKTALLAYLADKKIPHCHDSSNNERRFLRNRIRLDLLPLLEADYDPGIRQALLKTAANLAEDENLLDDLVAASWKASIELHQAKDAAHPTCHLNRTAFCALHPALQRRLLEKLLWQLGNIAHYEQIMSLLHAVQAGRNGSELHLHQGLRVTIHREHLEFSYPQGKGPWRGRLASR